MDQGAKGKDQIESRAVVAFAVTICACQAGSTVEVSRVLACTTTGVPVVSAVMLCRVESLRTFGDCVMSFAKRERTAESTNAPEAGSTPQHVIEHVLSSQAHPFKTYYASNDTPLVTGPGTSFRT